MPDSERQAGEAEIQTRAPCPQGLPGAHGLSPEPARVRGGLPVNEVGASRADRVEVKVGTGKWTPRAGNRTVSWTKIGEV